MILFLIILLVIILFLNLEIRSLKFELINITTNYENYRAIILQDQNLFNNEVTDILESAIVSHGGTL